MAALTSGCGSLSFPMGNVFGDDKADVTGSVRKKIDTGKVPEADWRVARGAVRQALSAPDAAVSVAWENPSTGARGTVTPLPTRDLTPMPACRSFLLSHVRANTETWHQGEACQEGAEWEVQSVRSLDKLS